MLLVGMHTYILYVAPIHWPGCGMGRRLREALAQKEAQDAATIMLKGLVTPLKCECSGERHCQLQII